MILLDPGFAFSTVLRTFTSWVRAPLLNSSLKPPIVSAVIEEFPSVTRNSLRGFARVRLPSGLILHDTAIHERDGKACASPASKPMLSRDGTVVRDAAGKTQYVPIISFAPREIRDRFSSAVIEAMRSAHPEAFEP